MKIYPYETFCYSSRFSSQRAICIYKTLIHIDRSAILAEYVIGVLCQQCISKENSYIMKLIIDFPIQQIILSEGQISLIWWLIFVRYNVFEDE